MRVSCANKRVVMTKSEAQTAASSTLATDSLAHKVALGGVGLTMVGGAVVFTEPAPFDVLGLGLLILLPAMGLVLWSRAYLAYAAMLLVPVGCSFAATLAAIDQARAATHTTVTLFLVVISLLLTAFVLKAPERHTRLILQGTCLAGVIATTAGIIGYMGLFPGANDIFTIYGRASGTFKDPNVFGAFLVLPAIMLLHTLRAARGVKFAASLGGLVLLTLGVLLSFSRGAWFNLAMAALLYTYLAFVTAATSRDRIRLAVGAGAVVFAAIALVAVALQFDAVADLFSERAALTQSYDEGPEGRFGGQEKAKQLILSHPFGLGAQQFDGFYHLEEAHNVYLTMFMNAGWLGGLMFVALVSATVAFGARHAFVGGATQGLFLVVYAVFVAHALEGFVIDLDHWRHFHLLMALCWGLMLSERAALALPRMRARAYRTITRAPTCIA